MTVTDYLPGPLDAEPGGTGPMGGCRVRTLGGDSVVEWKNLTTVRNAASGELVGHGQLGVTIRGEVFLGHEHLGLLHMVAGPTLEGKLVVTVSGDNSTTDLEVDFAKHVWP